MSFLSFRSFRLSNLIGPLLFLCIYSVSQAQSPLLDEDKFEELMDANQQDSLRNLLGAQEQKFKNLSQAEIALTYYLSGVLAVEEEDYAIAKAKLKKGLDALGESDKNLEYKMRTQLVLSYQYSYELDSMKMQLDVLDQMEPLDSLSKALNHYATYIYYYRSDSKDIALENILEARELLWALGRKTQAARFDSYIGRLYQDLDNDTLAAHYQNQALDYLISNEEFDSASYVYLERGSYYNNLGEWEKAISDLKECIRLSEISGNLSNVANASQFISASYTELGEFELAEAAIDRSMAICEEYDIEICFVYAHMHYAKLYLASGEYEKAEASSKILSEYSLDYYADEARQGYGLLADAYEAQGKYQDAYSAKLKETALVDSLFQAETQAAMGELREKYQREKNQAEIQSLKDQAEIDALKRNGLWVGLIGVLILSLIILNREIQRRKKAKALHESQLEIQRLEKLRLEEQIQTKNRELSNKALTIAKKNELLHKLQNDLQAMMDEAGSKECVRQVVNTLRIETAIEGHWEQFSKQFTELNPDFYKRLTAKSEDLTKGDLRLAALMRMNLSSKDIANMLNISDEGVKKARQRFRKKLELESTKQLETFLLAL